MAARAGRSGGSNRISIDAHRLRGTLTAARHTRRAAVTVAAIPRIEPVPADVIDGLTGRGRRYVETVWSMYSDWTPTPLAYLHEAGRLLDEVDRVRGQKAERGVQKLLLSVLGALRLDVV